MRSRAVAVVALLSLTALTACDGSDEQPDGQPEDSSLTSGGEPADPTSDVAEPDATFRATIDSTGSVVVVSYTFTNNSNSPVVVPNQLPTLDGAYDDSRQTVYVTGADEGTAVISQRVFATPDTDRKDWAQAPRTGVSTVAGGGVISVDIQVPLPLERRQPYGDDLGYGTIALPDPLERVRFCLGVIASPYPPALGLDRAQGTTSVAHGNASNSAQYLYCTDDVEL